MGRYEGTGRNHEGYRDPTAERAVRKVDLPLRDWRDYDAMRSMRYADGTPIERGDVVYIPGESALKTYRVIGYDARRRMACIADMDGMHVHEVPPSALSRW